MRPPFPSVVDSTILSAFRACPRKFELEYLLHFKPRDPSVHLHAGGAYAKGLEVARTAYFVDGRTHEEAVALGLRALLTFYGDFECPPDSAKSAERTAGALEFYFERYPMDTDAAVPMRLPGGKRGIEFSFAQPLEFMHPVTGDPLLYCGRMDMMVDFEGMHLGEDDKTASQLGGSWAGQWDLRSQFTSYVWGAGEGGIKLDGFLVRGVSILKTKYDTLQALTYRPEWQISRWYAQVIKDLTRMRQMWESGEFDYNLDASCDNYGGCLFKRVCLMQDPTPLLAMNFTRRIWDPLNRVETVLPMPEPVV